MRREDCVEMFERIPEMFHAQVNVVMRNQGLVSVDFVSRFEPMYVVLRGREGGTTDEGRAFFIPYEEIAYLRLERVVKPSELKKMYGEDGGVDAEDRLAAESNAEDAKANPVPAVAPIDTQTPGPVSAADPAEIAKKNLLERIRATRASVTGTTGRLGSK